MLLYVTFHSVSEATIVMLSVVYAMTGGVILQWWLGYNFSVAVWIGYIALYGVAVQTGVVMASLIPILWSTGVGSDIMKPIAAPIIGGMVTSTIHVLVITPVIFYITKLRALRAGRLGSSIGAGEHVRASA
jgi:Cu(I)/Ag(I) efflux system membrane protein CusA/SilA